MNHNIISMHVPACRTGWRGVWDATKAWFTGNTRMTAPRNITFSVQWHPVSNGGCTASQLTVYNDIDEEGAMKIGDSIIKSYCLAVGEKE